MKVALVVYGSRGDVQPMLALAIGLMNKGHEVIFCASPDNEEFVKKYQVPFAPFGKNLKEVFKNANIKGGATVQLSPREGRKIIAEQIDRLPAYVNGYDIILAAGIILGVPTVADSLKIPYRFVAFYPMILGTGQGDPWINRNMFRFGRFLINLFSRRYINTRREDLGVPPIRDVWQYWMGEDVIVACDREVNAVKEGVSFAYTQTGYLLLPSQHTLPAPVEAFLNAGNPPVYIGFGSNPISGKKEYSELFMEVAGTTQQRLIVSKGWADLPGNDHPDILFVDELPFELLFPHLSAIIHHGGTGTIAYAIRSGVPQAAFPFMADQFENRKKIIKLGLGPKTCDFNKMTAASISEAISECMKNNHFKKNALALSKRLEHVDGLQQTIDYLEKGF